MLKKVWTWIKGLPKWIWLVVIAALALLARGSSGLLSIFKRKPVEKSPGVSPKEGEKAKAEATSIADAAVKAAEDYAESERDRLAQKYGGKP
jgi:hypothetical protein